MIKVKSTTDYSQFKFMRGNRPIDRRIKKMIRAIKRKNMLADFPILCTANGDGRRFICDGQTRFEAAKQLKLPIFYIESKSVSIADISEANSVQTPWRPKDFISSFAEQGNPHYVKLRSFLAEFGLPVTTSAVLMMGKETNFGGNQGGGDAIRMGSFTVKAEDNARRVAGVIVALKSRIPFATDRGLVIAIAKLMRVEAFDAQRMLKKLASHGSQFVKCANWQQYVELIEKIYNYHVTAAQLVPLSIEVKKLK